MFFFWPYIIFVFLVVYNYWIVIKWLISLSYFSFLVGCLREIALSFMYEMYDELNQYIICTMN
jgi:hypothetical protein